METDFLGRGLRLIANGYRIIPIHAGQKRPGLDEWQMLQATPAMVKKWASNGFANGNIGILTAHNPAIDLDIYDAEMADKMEAWCIDEFGGTAVRVGRAPKRLLVFSAVEPFTKVYADYVDPRGTKHRVEVLGDGQQFVAYGIHPETRQPFSWVSLDEPLDKPAEDLPTLTAEMAGKVISKWGEFAKAAGWTFKGGSAGGSAVVKSRGTDDDALVSLKPRLKLTFAEVTDALAHVDGADDYDRWLMVGMALHHQSKGAKAGLDVWHEWSQEAHNYDASVLDSKWKSFDDMPSRNAVTFASVLKIANEHKKQESVEEFNRALNVLRTATSEDEIFGPIAKQLTKAITSDFQMDIVAKKMQDRVQELTEVKPRIETIRKALVAAKMSGREKQDTSGMPTWCKDWVYLKNGDRFYNLDTKSDLTERGFNAVHDRLVLSDEDRMLGVAIPSSRAASLALNIYNVPTVDNTVYLPGFDKIVDINGKKCANTFDETSVPAAKEPTTGEEFEAIARVENHFAVLFPDEEERTMVLDYLTYNVQFPIEKIVWALIVQGVEGAGKTLLSKLMSRVLGPQNVGPVSATELQDKYTGWAEGKKLIFIEEIRLHGSNRYEVLDKMKPYVSNEEATIRRMFGDSYVIPNVGNYVMFTNYWDGLPFSRMDRRYYVVATSFQSKEQMDAWNAKHPRYFSDLYDAIRDHGEVLRHWFLTRPLSPKFQPKRPALDTEAKHKMRDLSESSDESDVLNDILEASTDPELSDRLLNAEKLKAAFDDAGQPCPYGRSLSNLLAKAGFLSLGRFRIGGKGEPNVRFYTRKPDLFPRHRELEVIRTIQTDNLLAFDNADEDPFA
jgi:hypothetical protein